MNNTKAQKINVPSRWHKEQIKAAIRMRGITMEQLSLMNGMNKNAVGLAFIKPYPKAEKIIAEFLGVSLHELWPDRWTSDGQRIRPRYAYLYINTDACSVAA